jgi:hypothetical protein
MQSSVRQHCGRFFSLEWNRLGFGELPEEPAAIPLPPPQLGSGLSFQNVHEFSAGERIKNKRSLSLRMRSLSLFMSIPYRSEDTYRMAA